MRTVGTIRKANCAGGGMGVCGCRSVRPRYGSGSLARVSLGSTHQEDPDGGRAGDDAVLEHIHQRVQVNDHGAHLLVGLVPAAQAIAAAAAEEEAARTEEGEEQHAEQNGQDVDLQVVEIELHRYHRVL